MKSARSQQGAAVVEFALLCGLLLVFLLGVFEFGILWLESHYVANAAREGARVAAKKDSSSNRQAAAQTAVETYLVGSMLFSADGETLRDAAMLTSVQATSEEISATPPVDGVRITVTVNSGKIWKPILLPFIMAVIPGSDADELEGLSDLNTLIHSAIYAIETT